MYINKKIPLLFVHSTLTLLWN